MATKPIATTEFEIIIITPDQVLLQDKATRMFVPGIHQELAILPDHTPLYAQLVKGEIKITLSSGKLQTFDIETGIMRVKQNRVSVVLGFGTT